jgi:hypothetical protein
MYLQSTAMDTSDNYITTLLCVYILTGLFALIIWISIFTKAGFSKLMALLMFIPILNFFVFLYFAFTEWPIERQNNQMRRKLGIFTKKEIKYMKRQEEIKKQIIQEKKEEAKRSKIKTVKKKQIKKKVKVVFK